jgi:1,4-alpha-glucan branching enzyme
MDKNHQKDQDNSIRCIYFGCANQWIFFSHVCICLFHQVFSKQIRWYQSRSPVTQKNSLTRKTKMIQFSLEAGDAKKVSLVGEFNNWNPDADPMQRDGNGAWTKTKLLSPGNMEYKFWVDGQWIQDPENLRTCPNCFGTRNNILKIIL